MEERDNPSSADENLRPKEDEVEMFLGANPAAAAEIDLRDDLLARIKVWLLKGLATKEEKQNLLNSIPRKEKLNLEAPLFNDEILVDTQPRSLSRDDFFKDYQNLTGSALSAVSNVLNMILKDAEEPLEREKVLSNLSNSLKFLSHLFLAFNQARKSFIMGKYEDKIQKVLKKVESTTHLFGDNLKAVIDSSKVMEKAAKDLKPKTKSTLKPSNSLNWRSLPDTAINLLNKDEYMYRLDLHDAYLKVALNLDDKKFLRFNYRNHLYQFNALPFGLSSAPFVFTKIAKPIGNWL